jgi:hypothetical protein
MSSFITDFDPCRKSLAVAANGSCRMRDEDYNDILHNVSFVLAGDEDRTMNMTTSALVLILANMIPLTGVAVFQWRVIDILILYWTESVLICP